MSVRGSLGAAVDRAFAGLGDLALPVTLEKRRRTFTPDGPAVGHETVAAYSGLGVWRTPVMTAGVTVADPRLRFMLVKDLALAPVPGDRLIVAGAAWRVVQTADIADLGLLYRLAVQPMHGV